MDLPITIIAGTLPAGAVYNPQTYFNAIVARMTASVTGGNIVFGQLGGNEPNGPLPGNGATPGLWYGTSAGASAIWQQWNADAAKYLPIPVTCGQYVNAVLQTTDILCGAVTGSWKVVTPDKGGVMALLDDLPSSLGTQTPTGTVITPNWNDRRSIYVVLSGNLTFNLPTGADDGQIMDYFIENPSGTTDWTVTWGGIHWTIGTGFPPVQSVHTSGFRVIDHYRIQFQGGNFWGEVVAQNMQVAIGAQIVVPTVVSLTANANTISIQFNANLLGGSIPTADFNVLVNGTAVTLTSATANGTFCSIGLSTALHPNDVVTLQYTGSDLKSIQNNSVAHFGPSPVSLSNVGNPSSPGGGGGLFHHYIP